MSAWALETSSPLLCSEWSNSKRGSDDDELAVIVYQPDNGDLHVLGVPAFLILKTLDKGTSSLEEITTFLNGMIEDGGSLLQEQEVLQQFLFPLKDLQLICETKE